MRVIYYTEAKLYEENFVCLVRKDNIENKVSSCIHSRKWGKTKIQSSTVQMNFRARINVNVCVFVTVFTLS